ncbi:DNA-3-methyladenine glycosylase I [Dongshaea marina]|uniref:DNA-3-methyladenine glycosylase I n=1 Tax=Dongshaea marina TaxID=2047966 RepID=UPI000D3E850B|nr:DNA-3-methyladenine glycosylase I [Dongshaea marina]
MGDQSRCGWVGVDAQMIHYHDYVWGRPERDGRALFEKLCLDGQQAGLSWSTILKRVPDYRRLFAGFDPEKLSRFTEQDVERLMQDSSIIRNRAKINAIIGNARAYLRMQQQGIDFSEYIWSFVQGKQLVNPWQSIEQIPASTAESRAMARELKKRGFSFVGETICYAFMQAVGIVNDHLVSCDCHAKCIEKE